MVAAPTGHQIWGDLWKDTRKAAVFNSPSSVPRASETFWFPIQALPSMQRQLLPSLLLYKPPPFSHSPQENQTQAADDTGDWM